MRLRSRLRECLCLNWAVPVSHLPKPPQTLRYEVHSWEGTDYALASALLFRHEDVHPETLPLVKLSFPQLNLRLYVVDEEDAPAVLFVAILVPSWVVPAAVLLGGQPARPARFERQGEPGSASGSWEWRVTAHGGWGWGGPALHCVATVGSPKVGAGPQIGTWQRTVDYVRLRNRGYARSRCA